MQIASKNRVKAKVAQTFQSELELREAKEKAGLHLCDAQCPTTGRFCTGVFLTSKGKADHSKHKFESGVSSKDRIIMWAGNPGGVLTAGVRPDRLGTVTSCTFMPCRNESDATRDAECLGAFNRNDTVTVYHKPATLLKDLKELFSKEPKLDAIQMHQELQQMKDPKDGGLKYCYSKRGTFCKVSDLKTWPGCKLCGTAETPKNPCTCNGMLISVECINSWISSETQKRKKNKKTVEE